MLILNELLFYHYVEIGIAIVNKNFSNYERMQELYLPSDLCMTFNISSMKFCSIFVLTSGTSSEIYLLEYSPIKVNTWSCLVLLINHILF